MSLVWSDGDAESVESSLLLCPWVLDTPKDFKGCQEVVRLVKEVRHEVVCLALIKKITALPLSETALEVGREQS